MSILPTDCGNFLTPDCLRLPPFPALPLWVYPSCPDRCLSSEPAQKNFKFICGVSCLHSTWERKQAEVIEVEEGSILPHAAIDFHAAGPSVSNTLATAVVTTVEVAWKAAQQNLDTLPKVMLHQHPPPLCLRVCLLLSDCLFLGQTDFFQDPLIIFSFRAKYKPCYPLCLEHPPTF